MRPYAAASTAVPPVALRFDPGALVTAVGRYLPSLLANGAAAAKLTGPFSTVWDGEMRSMALLLMRHLAMNTHSFQLLDEVPVRDPFIRNWLDLLCFMLSGLPANGTIAAEVAFMFNECTHLTRCHTRAALTPHTRVPS